MFVYRNLFFCLYPCLSMCVSMCLHVHVCEWTYSYIDCCISQSSRKLMFKIFFWNYYDKDLISKTKIVSEYLNFFNFKEEIQSHAGLDKYMYDLHSLQHCCRRFICKFYSYCIKFWFLISLNIEPKSIMNLNLIKRLLFL